MEKCISLKNQLNLLNQEPDTYENKINEMLHSLPEVNYLITLRQNIVLKNNSGKPTDNSNVGKCS